MIHMSYDSSLVIGSAVVAVIACYLAISLEQLIYNLKHQQYKKIALIGCGLIFGFAIWSMHFIGMLACHLPKGHQFDVGLTLFSYCIAALASTFAIWLTTRETLPLGRLVLGSVLMGLGISGMHYVGMIALSVPDYSIHYDSLIVIFSVLIAISGSGLAFWLAFKYKNSVYYKKAYKFATACMFAFSIVGMHYTGMMAVTFDAIDHVALNDLHHQPAQGIVLIAVIFVTCLIMVAAFAVAILELRLEERNLQLLQVNKELENLALLDNLTKLPNRLFLVEYTDALFAENRLDDGKIAFIYIDLDRFKSVNDAFGHHVGDELLVKFAQRMHAQLNEQQKLIRVGGDEFVLIVEQTTQQQTEEIASKYLQCIQESFLIAGKDDVAPLTRPLKSFL